MQIGIIGAGMIGGTLTRLLAMRGHSVRVANSRGPQTLADIAAATGAQAVWAKDAAADADVVIISIPQRSVPDLVQGILSAARPGAAIIETNNYYPKRDGRIAAIEAGITESQWVAERLGVPVIKVFNTIWYRHLLKDGRPAGAPGRIALPVAGASGPAKTLSYKLVDELGFDPVDGGTLAESWRQQPGTPVYDKNLDAEAARLALASASPVRRQEFFA